jgi:hypothetical protein
LKNLILPNKTDHHDIAEILLKAALNTLTLTLNPAIDIIPKSTFSETMINSNLLSNSKTTFILILVCGFGILEKWSEALLNAKSI